MSMVRRKGAGAAFGRAGLHLGLALASLAVLLPILWVLRVALAPAAMSYSATILPGLSGEISPPSFRAASANPMSTAWWSPPVRSRWQCPSR